MQRMVTHLFFLFSLGWNQNCICNVIPNSAMAAACLLLYLYAAISISRAILTLRRSWYSLRWRAISHFVLLSSFSSCWIVSCNQDTDGSLGELQTQWKPVGCSQELKHLSVCVCLGRICRCWARIGLHSDWTRGLARTGIHLFNPNRNSWVGSDWVWYPSESPPETPSLESSGLGDSLGSWRSGREIWEEIFQDYTSSGNHCSGHPMAVTLISRCS